MDKNPSVKSETILFLARCFQQCTPAMMPKAMLKAFCPPLVQVSTVHTYVHVSKTYVCTYVHVSKT